MFVVLFFILAHILVGETLFLPALGLVLANSLLYLVTPTMDVGYIVVVVLMLLTIAVAVIWLIKIIKGKGTFFDYLQPFIFLFSTIVTLIVISYRDTLQAFYSAEATRLIVLYMFIAALFIMAYGYHLMVFGLARFSKANKEVKEEKPVTEALAGLTEAQVREIVAQELAKQKPTVVEKTVIVKEEPKVEAKPEPKKVEEPKVVEPTKPVEVKKSEPVAPKVEPTPVVAEETEFERLSFEERIQSFDQEVLAKYQELKDYMLSYGVKSRISSSGDSFRAKRVMYFKITNSGNSGFKVFYKLDLASYANTTFPLKDATGIKMYEEVPTFMYLKSDLSLKRAKELVDDVMIANGFKRKE